MIRLWRWALVCSLVQAAVLAAVPVQAQEVPPRWDDSYYPYAREGFYFGISGHYALENFDTDPAVEVAPTSSSADDGGGIGVSLGYRVHSRVAAELLFQYFWGFEIRNRVAGVGAANDEFDGFGLTANAKLYPLLGRIQPYGVVGLGGISFRNKRKDDNGFIARMGAGVDLYVSDRIVLDAEIAYVFPGGSISELQFATFAAGFQYRY